MRTIIGLCGFAGSGKDEAAKALVERRGFVRVGFADILKEVLYKLNPIIEDNDQLWGRQRVSKLVDVQGWDAAKRNYPELRKLLQRLGTEVGRELFGENFWVDRALVAIDKLPLYQPVVITDVRFKNEANAIRYRGGKVFLIERPGVTAVNDHISDTGITELAVDNVIVNDGTIEDLHSTILQRTDDMRPTQQLFAFEGETVNA